MSLGIEYHLAVGCSRIYIFWDNTTDNAPELVAKYPQVVARKSFRPEELANPPEWFVHILPPWGDDLDVRKIANTYYATLDAAQDGIEWLVSIDADELLMMNRDEQVLQNHAPKYLSQVPETSSCCPISSPSPARQKQRTRSSIASVSSTVSQPLKPSGATRALPCIAFRDRRN